MDADAARARMLLEESREAVVVVDGDDRVLVASRRARESIQGLEEGAKLPDRVGDPNTGPGTVEKFFNTDAFAVPAPYTFGNAGIGTVTGPGINSVDLSLVKNMTITDRVRLQFRVEAFNAFNHLIMGDPVTEFGNPLFGQVTSTRLDNREMQFALRLEF